MSEMLSKIFNKNLNTMKDLSEKIDNKGKFESIIKNTKVSRELKKLSREMNKSEDGKEIYNNIINASASLTLNSSDNKVVGRSIYRLSESINEKLDLKLTSDDVKSVTQEMSKSFLILENMLTPQNVTIGNIKNITFEYSLNTKNFNKKRKMENVSNMMSNIGYLTNQITMLNSFSIALGTMASLVTKHIEKYQSNKRRFGVVDIFLTMGANIVKVIEDALKWDTKYEGNTTVGLIMGVIQKIFYASVIVTSIFSLIVVVLTLAKALPVFSVFAGFFEAIITFVSVFLVPLITKVGSAVIGVAVYRTIKELSGFNLYKIIYTAIESTTKFALGVFGRMYDFVTSFLDKYSTKVEPEDKPEKPEEPDIMGGEEDDDDILTQLGGMAGAMGRTFMNNKREISRSIAHELYRTL